MVSILVRIRIILIRARRYRASVPKGDMGAAIQVRFFSSAGTLNQMGWVVFPKYG